MEVVNDCVALLSNQEVLSLLNDIQTGKGYRKPNSQQQNLATICYETAKYLEKTPCQHQDAELVKDFTKRLEPYKLTKAEKLQLLNHLPTTAVEIQLLIEESEERLSEEQTDEILTIVAEYLPAEPNNSKAESMDDS